MALLEPGKRVVGYIRVSSEEQTKGYSIDGQKEDIQTWINDSGWDFKKWYVEEGVSGDHDKLDKRTKLAELLVDAKNDNFDGVLVWNLDRFSRDTRDTLDLVDKLKDSNVRIMTSDMRSIDYWSYTGRMVMTNQSAFNEFFLAQLKEKVKMGVGRKQKGGEAHGRAPYGFRRISDNVSGRKTNTRNEINPDEIKVVERIIVMFESDNGYSKIARELDTQGIKPRATGKKAKTNWNPSTIRSIVSRFYDNRDEYPF
jgi:site-specific DNA recombinase